MQKRNQFKILVSFPAEWPDAPGLAGETIPFWYPTLAAAELAAAGFRLRGCTV